MPGRKQTTGPAGPDRIERVTKLVGAMLLGGSALALLAGLMVGAVVFLHDPLAPISSLSVVRDAPPDGVIRSSRGSYNGITDGSEPTSQRRVYETAAAPEAILRRYRDRHGLAVVGPNQAAGQVEVTINGVPRLWRAQVRITARTDGMVPVLGTRFVVVTLQDQ